MRLSAAKARQHLKEPQGIMPPSPTLTMPPMVFQQPGSGSGGLMPASAFDAPGSMLQPAASSAPPGRSKAAKVMLPDGGAGPHYNNGFTSQGHSNGFGSDGRFPASSAAATSSAAAAAAAAAAVAAMSATAAGVHTGQASEYRGRAPGSAGGPLTPTSAQLVSPKRRAAPIEVDDEDAAWRTDPSIKPPYSYATMIIQVSLQVERDFLYTFILFLFSTTSCLLLFYFFSSTTNLGYQLAARSQADIGWYLQAHYGPLSLLQSAQSFWVAEQHSPQSIAQLLLCAGAPRTR